jgi:cytochrome c2
MKLMLHLVLAAVALVLIPLAVLEKPVTALAMRDLWTVGWIAAAYGAWILWLALRHAGDAGVGFSRLIVAGCVVAAPALLAIMAAYPDLPRELLAVSIALGLLLAIATWRLRGWGLVAVAAVLAVGGLVLQGLLVRAEAGPRPRTVAHLGSALYDLSVETYEGYFPRTEAQQGGISLFDDRYVLVNGDGRLFLFSQDAKDRNLAVQPLGYEVPVNRKEFSAAGGPQHGGRTWFRVADVLAQPTDRGHRLYVTHHHWNAQQSCWVLRVSALEGTTAELLDASSGLVWRTIYDSQPCMPLSIDGGPLHFSGLNNGGRMVLLDEQQLLVSIGDHEMDGYATALRAAQEPAGSYGKTVLIDLHDPSARIFSLGHRNPQGLALAADGRIWSTEHGPQGGDELNLVRQDANYGWPLESYGAEYGTHGWPLSAIPGSHDVFTQPFYSWVPSIGVSSLVEVRSERFAHWNGDLLVASLKGRALWRLRVRDDRVVMAEQIEFGRRIRDLEIGHSGEIVLMSDGGQMHFIAPTEGQASGEGLYRVCAGCHVAPNGSGSAVAPDLSGVVGRKVASDRGFEYSTAMRAVEGRWTTERLDAFLADPTAVVPGTTMQFNGIRDPAAREVLIRYMASPDARLDVMPSLRE